jgi:hypothetical protein
MDSLEICHDASNVGESPAQSNCGCLLTTSAGSGEPQELLNRWIVPLEPLRLPHARHRQNPGPFDRSSSSPPT